MNAITDVPGLEVGHTTLISGDGPLIVGKGPIRTGVTAILPRGKKSADRVFAGWFSQNGNGEMTGTTWVEESGFLEGPIMITNTHSVGVVRDCVIEWLVKKKLTNQPWVLPVVAETYDGVLNDINGFHIKKPHVFEALEIASSGEVEEGCVGGGSGMICFEFKGGIGTISRNVQIRTEEYTVGVLVQANFGNQKELRIAGVPIGIEIPENTVWDKLHELPDLKAFAGGEEGSIIIIIATNVPLLSHQLKRLARRATLALGRVGTISSNFSGDIFFAFSTANPGAANPEVVTQVDVLPNDQIDPVFEAVVQATEEAIINAVCAAETTIGRDNFKVIAIPHERLKTVLKKYGRLLEDNET